MGIIVLLAPEVIPLSGLEWVDTQRMQDTLMLQGFTVRWVKTAPELMAYLPWACPDVLAYLLYFAPANVADISSDGVAAAMESRWAPLQWIRQQDTSHVRPVFVLSGHYLEVDHVSALQHGADRYFLASASITVLLTAVQAHQRTVTSGLFSDPATHMVELKQTGSLVPPPEVFNSVYSNRSPRGVIPDPLATGSLNAVTGPFQQPSSNGDPASVNLTPREHEIVLHLAKGASNSAIAQALSISPTTVKNHLAHVYKKLGVTNRTEAAYRAQKFQWLE
ncbi:MAG: response regulator transcription factor [Vampirovibrionales bacterium]|nr:response regulator transcription factor [Vampirovibrionales bacterium]